MKKTPPWALDRGGGVLDENHQHRSPRMKSDEDGRRLLYIPMGSSPSFFSFLSFFLLFMGRSYLVGYFDDLKIDIAIITLADFDIDLSLVLFHPFHP